MLTTALVVVAASCPQAQDPLDELFARAAATKRLRAEFVLTRSAKPEPTVYTLDYAAPARMRLTQRDAAEVIDTWVIGATVSQRITAGGQTLSCEIDYAKATEQLRVVEARARVVAPALQSCWKLVKDRTQPICKVEWSYDAEKDAGNFEAGVGVSSLVGSPFGWLATVREKGLVWTRDGELLRSATDGPFAVALAPTGLLQELFARIGDRTLRFELRRATFDEDPPAERFVVPPAVELDGEAADEERVWRRSIAAKMRQTDGMVLQVSLFGGWAAAKAAAGDEATSVRLDEQAKQAARVILEDRLASRVAAYHQAFEEPIADAAKQIAAGATVDGRPEHVAAMRAKSAEALTAALRRRQSEFADGFVAVLGEQAAFAEFRAIELAAIEAIYRERVVDVALARLQAASDEALR